MLKQETASVWCSVEELPSCNFEHSWGDGVAVMRWVNDVWNTASEKIEAPVAAITL